MKTLQNIMETHEYNKCRRPERVKLTSITVYATCIHTCCLWSFESTLVFEVIGKCFFPTLQIVEQPVQYSSVVEEIPEGLTLIDSGDIARDF
jgi:hypothetical protein